MLDIDPLIVDQVEARRQRIGGTAPAPVGILPLIRIGPGDPAIGIEKLETGGDGGINIIGAFPRPVNVSSIDIPQPETVGGGKGPIGGGISHSVSGDPLEGVEAGADKGIGVFEIAILHVNGKGVAGRSDDIGGKRSFQSSA